MRVLAGSPWWIQMTGSAIAGAAAVVLSFLLSTHSAKQAHDQSLEQRVTQLEAAEPERDKRLERIENRVDDIYRLMLQKQQAKP